MFTDCCLLPSRNPLGDIATASPLGSDGRWAHSLILCPAPQSALHHHPTLVFCCCYCYYCFVFYFLPIFLAWFMHFLPFETLTDNLISLPKQTDAHPGLPHFPFCVLPFLLSWFFSSEDLTITSVLQKCLNIFLRPLWIFFFP